MRGTDKWHSMKSVRLRPSIGSKRTLEMVLKRGDVYWVDFDPSVGEEIQKIRPAVIVSNDDSNDLINRFQVVPLSSSTQRYYPSEAQVEIRGKFSKAMADQLTTASRKRFRSRIGRLSKEDLEQVEYAILFQLGIR